MLALPRTIFSLQFLFGTSISHFLRDLQILNPYHDAFVHFVGLRLWEAVGNVRKQGEYLEQGYSSGIIKSILVSVKKNKKNVSDKDAGVVWLKTFMLIYNKLSSWNET